MTRPKTGGRKRGTPNKATADLKAAAAVYTKDALMALVSIATKGESEAARVSAAVAILDRAHGKPTLAFEMSGRDGAPIEARVISNMDRAKALASLVAGLKTTPQQS